MRRTYAVLVFALMPAIARAAAPAPCSPSATTLCLHQARFSASVAWKDFQGRQGVGQAVAITDDTGYFWFFDSTNTEMVVKVLNGCAISTAYWVFAAGLTNVQVDWQVLDTRTGTAYLQVNPQGTPFAPIQATTAFPSSCP